MACASVLCIESHQPVAHAAVLAATGPDGSLTGSVNPFLWLAAIVPLLTLLLLVARGRASTQSAAALTLGITVALALIVFGASGSGLSSAMGKGLWTGGWILLVIWSALLMQRACQQFGMSQLGTQLVHLFPRRSQSILVVAWIFPSFVQGVAGFGAPIAIVAPLLAAMGLRATSAVALPLIGYHWSIGFGSVGSSFYMGALTARLSPSETENFAQVAALILGLNAILAGLLVCIVAGGRQGLRECWLLLVLAGGAMAGTLALVVRLEPAIGSLAAGTAGLTVAGAYARVTKRRERRSTSASQPNPVHTKRAPWVLLPYGVLLLSVLAVLAPSPSREWAKSVASWGPSFGASHTDLGFDAPATKMYQPLSLFAHPATFILLSVGAAIATWRLSGRWNDGATRSLLASWLRAALRASPSVLALTSVATVMADSGMIRTIALGVETATGDWYPLWAGTVGALGSFLTGSTTTSNALFSGMQADVANLLGTRSSHLMAAQLAGGNVGGILSPVVILLGTSAIGERDLMRKVLAKVAVPALVLLGSVMIMTMVVQ